MENQLPAHLRPLYPILTAKIETEYLPVLDALLKGALETPVPRAKPVPAAASKKAGS